MSARVVECGAADARARRLDRAARPARARESVNGTKEDIARHGERHGSAGEDRARDGPAGASRAAARIRSKRRAKRAKRAFARRPETRD